ncbi:unnamed protein product [Prorocentrum cordatum]|uniref:Uncharacterized protein n=1 Tax=Prorocentrum cordatum TaxID=2364126 RepID=A0ABN9V3P5_9DINO|nr:unnamed protein product [Polarella glacialis]
MDVEDCRKKSDVMNVGRTEFFRNHLQLHTCGSLSRSVSGGTVSVRMHKSAAAAESPTRNPMERRLAWHSDPGRYEEGLRQQVGESPRPARVPLPSRLHRAPLRHRRAAAEGGRWRPEAEGRRGRRGARRAGGARARAHVKAPRGRSGKLLRSGAQGASTALRERVYQAPTICYQMASAVQSGMPVLASTPCGRGANLLQLPPLEPRSSVGHALVAYPTQCVATMGGPRLVCATLTAPKLTRRTWANSEAK